MLFCRRFIVILVFLLSVVAHAAGPFIDEILNLKDGQKIPDAVFEKYSSNAIAESIVERLNRKQHSEASEPDFLRDAEVHLVFPKEAAASIVQNGFLNFHQTNRRAGSISQKVKDPERFVKSRIEVENQMSGLVLEPSSPLAQQKVLQVRPKSAFLVIPNQDEGLISFGGYGDIIAIPKTELRTRMTWTPSDSYGSPEEYDEANTFFHYDKKEPPPAFRYYEAQIWGDLKVSDVKEFWVPKDLPAETMTELRKTHLDIYRYELLKPKGFFVHKAERGAFIRPDGALEVKDETAATAKAPTKRRPLPLETFVPQSEKSISLQSNFSSEPVAVTLLGKEDAMCSGGETFYKVKLADGKLGLLKVATLDSASQHAVLTENGQVVFARLNQVPVSEVVDLGSSFRGSNWVIKDYVDGPDAHSWLESWKKRGSTLEDPLFQKLRNLPANLDTRKIRWDGQEWRVLDLRSTDPVFSLAHSVPPKIRSSLRESLEVLSQRLQHPPVKQQSGLERVLSCFRAHL